MATTENRGGANGGPQYNPMNVNPLGGNGQSGNIDYSGFAYKMNQSVNEQRKAAPISTPTRRTSVPFSLQGREVIGLTEPTAYPDQPIGPVSPEAQGFIPNILPEQGQMLPEDTDTQLIRSYLPAMEFWASMPGTPQTTKDYVRFLRTKI